MRMIRPYGTSAVERDLPVRRRTLRRKPEPPATEIEYRVDVEGFAKSHDALVIGQWISAIDKVAAKPPPGKAPSAKQRALRPSEAWVRRRPFFCFKLMEQGVPAEEIAERVRQRFGGETSGGTKAGCGEQRLSAAEKSTRGDTVAT